MKQVVGHLGWHVCSWVLDGIWGVSLGECVQMGWVWWAFLFTTITLASATTILSHGRLLLLLPSPVTRVTFKNMIRLDKFLLKKLQWLLIALWLKPRFLLTFSLVDSQSLLISPLPPPLPTFWPLCTICPRAPGVPGSVLLSAGNVLHAALPTTGLLPQCHLLPEACLSRPSSLEPRITFKALLSSSHTQGSISLSPLNRTPPAEPAEFLESDHTVVNKQVLYF